MRNRVRMIAWQWKQAPQQLGQDGSPKSARASFTECPQRKAPGGRDRGADDRISGK